jgi:uncharacterized protein YaaQ
MQNNCNEYVSQVFLKRRNTTGIIGVEDISCSDPTKTDIENKKIVAIILDGVSGLG